MWENGIANGGQHVSLPTPGGRHMFEAWSASAPGFIAEMKNDQVKCQLACVLQNCPISSQAPLRMWCTWVRCLRTRNVPVGMPARLQEGLATLMPEHWEMGWLGARHCHSLREAADRENATKAIVRTFW